ncbi:MAG: bifunctional precorrin-2 dehydrogenase/sirohydrochlorin ferrochelatase [Lachnospiraceae bacterium]|nr:bifunctional precorrin-2 dehydrogenase/sirohydrochlorin ferrochelatase [Lachnospiraceae bacterium]MDY5742461.1 bifunctional precorrin-2 dehydrogenase/sirohydrochlorin ferrochelatase [Lachnospiraceae bacterium]
MTHFFPMFVDLQAQPVLVIGGGRIAARRIHSLLLFGAAVEVVAETITEELCQLPIDIRQQTLRPDKIGDLRIKQYRLVLAATDQRELNHAVYQHCRNQGVTVNVCDCPAECDFYFPAVAVTENIVAGISTSGQNHRLAAKAARTVRAALQEEMPLKKKGTHQNGSEQDGGRNG